MPIWLLALRTAAANDQKPNQALLEQTLLEVSTPNHHRYGKHLKRDELKAMLRPAAEATESIISWLENSGIPEADIEDDGEWINFIATVSQAELMMDTEFSIYRSTVRENVKKIRTLQYSVPQELHQYIDMIQPTTRFGQLRPAISSVLDKEILGAVGTVKAVNASCNSTITPACLKQLYNLNGFTATNNTLLGINGFLEEYARFADLEDFLSLYAPWAVGANFTWTSIDGMCSTIPVLTLC